MSFIVTLAFITYVVFLFTEKRHHAMPEDQTGIVIHKTEGILNTQNVFVLHSDTTIGSFNCYDILYDRIEVGDSIINGKIKKNE